MTALAVCRGEDWVCLVIDAMRGVTAPDGGTTSFRVFNKLRIGSGQFGSVVGDEAVLMAACALIEWHQQAELDLHDDKRMWSIASVTDHIWRRWQQRGQERHGQGASLVWCTANRALIRRFELHSGATTPQPQVVDVQPGTAFLLYGGPPQACPCPTRRESAEQDLIKALQRRDADARFAGAGLPYELTDVWSSATAGPGKPLTVRSPFSNVFDLVDSYF